MKKGLRNSTYQVQCFTQRTQRPQSFLLNDKKKLCDLCVLCVKHAFILPIISLLLAAEPLTAQQTPLSSLYQMNWQTINPATIDRSFYLNDATPMTIFTGSYRQQWIGFEGAPSNAFLSAEFLTERQDRYNVGAFTKFGISFLNDRFGAFNNWGVYGNYTYGFGGSGQCLYVGLSPGLIRSQISLSKNSSSIDPLIADYQGRSKLYFDLGVGVFYRNIEDPDRQFFCGLSIPQSLAVGLENDSLHQRFLPKNRLQHLNFLAGMFIDPTGEEQKGLRIEPSILVKYAPLSGGTALIPNLPLAFDVNCRAYLPLNRFVKKDIENFWLGAGYSSNTNLSIELGITKNLEDDARFGRGTRFVRIGLLYSVPLGNRFVNFGQTIEALASFSLE